MRPRSWIRLNKLRISNSAKSRKKSIERKENWKLNLKLRGSKSYLKLKRKRLICHKSQKIRILMLAMLCLECLDQVKGSTVDSLRMRRCKHYMTILIVLEIKYSLKRLEANMSYYRVCQGRYSLIKV